MIFSRVLNYYYPPTWKKWIETRYNKEYNVDMKKPDTTLESILQIFTDDKLLVILALTFIALIAMFRLSSPDTVVNSIVSGLLGVAVGRGIPPKG